MNLLMKNVFGYFSFYHIGVKIETEYFDVTDKEDGIMAFMDKLGQIANKVGDVAGDTLDYGKAKGKIVLEKGKMKDAKEELGDYIYRTRKAGNTPDENKLQEYCAKIDVHQAEIEKLEADAKLNGQVISDKLSREDEA